MQNISPILMVEKYADLISKGETSEAEALRKEIDYTDQEEICARLALLDYQRGGDIKALEAFLKEFDSHQMDIFWKIHLVISQHLSNNKDQDKQALEHAQISYRYAPPDHKQDVADLIELISKQTP